MVHMYRMSVGRNTDIPVDCYALSHATPQARCLYEPALFALRVEQNILESMDKTS